MLRAISFQLQSFLERQSDKGAPPIAADPGGFPDFRIFRFFGKCRFCEFSVGIWGSGRVCNGLEMAVGFKWTDSQPISSLLSPFPSMFMILVILESFPVVGCCFRKVPGPSGSALKVPEPCENVLWWSDADPGRSQDPLAVS